MADPSNPPIILFNFPESVFGRRLVRYLNLRRLPFSQVRVPPNMPRPILQERLGINHRRIPIMAVGRDIYIDTRLMLRKLESMFPEGAMGAKGGFEQGVEDILEEWTIDGGPFVRTSGCIPISAPFVQDKVWMKDRSDGSGGAFTVEALQSNRAWCLSQLRLFYGMLEKLLSDGREWILGGPDPTLAELHAGWVFDWGLNMAADMRAEGRGDDPTADMRTVLSETEFPKTHAWTRRWRKVADEAAEVNERGTGIDEGREVEDRVVKTILGSGLAEPGDLAFDENDILGLKRGKKVSIAPIDFGFTHEDTGPVVGLDKDEITIEIDAPERTTLRLHYPRINFNVRPTDGA